MRTKTSAALMDYIYEQICYFWTAYRQEPRLGNLTIRNYAKTPAEIRATVAACVWLLVFDGRVEFIGVGDDKINEGLRPTAINITIGNDNPE